MSCVLVLGLQTAGPEEECCRSGAVLCVLNLLTQREEGHGPGAGLLVDVGNSAAMDSAQACLLVSLVMSEEQKFIAHSSGGWKIQEHGTGL